MAVKTVVGRLGAVPELQAAGQKHVAKFSVAETKRKFDRDRNEWVDEFTIWHDVEAWTAPEQIAQLAKGTWVIVEGEERDASYQSRDTGQTVRRMVIRARTVGTVIRDAPQQRQQPGAGWASASTQGTDEVF
ncbi:single-stranded DNA-binding protein [Microbacterium sp. QXD-8]|uniref:Single-stranded DNA-binding protein n=1 Tax=Microbacterium psychrotolerans TaxID=3068321 RepID=A0ABU0YYE0_9MICO|nr:single-stranded DNA-binding protein [Microbacterium sp. QXD-8]MDQ7877348.1 single-stranded DNA-binding protein [Microbacterium sp. QXD-8]